MKFNLSVLAFSLMATVAMLFGFATLALELNLKVRELTQSGDSSLSRRSVNWLGGMALASACLICFVLA